MPDDKRELFTNLVKNGQLEIVGGGWVMNDEVLYIGSVYSHLLRVVCLLLLAWRLICWLLLLMQANSHYYAIIEQV